MILAQAVLRYFVDEVPYAYNGKVKKKKKTLKKGHNSVMKCPMEKENIWVLLFFILIPHIKFQDSISNRS